MVVPPDSPRCRAAAQAAVHPGGDERTGAATSAITPLAHDIATAFEFEVVVADTAELRAATFALRHQVYCQEYGFEPIRADGLERDAYDDRARHYLLAHVPSKAWAGCVRVASVEADDICGESR